MKSASNWLVTVRELSGEPQRKAGWIGARNRIQEAEMEIESKDTQSWERLPIHRTASEKIKK